MGTGYYSFGKYLRQRYPFRVYKIAVDAGFTCPNRDGTKGLGGCTYCENRSFSPNTGSLLSLEEQIEAGITFYRQRYQAERFIIYFQAYTNTHAPIERLRALYDRALSYPDVIGLAIGTRPDCVPEEVLDLLEGYASRVEIWLELGVQSIHDSTLVAINRGHLYKDFQDAVVRARRRKGLLLCTHAIFGLPSETREMMYQTAEKIAQLDLDGIKIHHFYVARGTPMHKMYEEGRFKVMGLEEWIKLVVDILERLPPRMVIQRLMGEIHGPYLIAPKWGVPKGIIIQAIQQELQRRGSFQGRLYPPRSTIPLTRLQ